VSARLHWRIPARTKGFVHIADAETDTASKRKSVDTPQRKHSSRQAETDAHEHIFYTHTHTHGLGGLVCEVGDEGVVVAASEECYGVSVPRRVDGRAMHGGAQPV
jgi:hypothetical protein